MLQACVAMWPAGGVRGVLRRAGPPHGGGMVAALQADLEAARQDAAMARMASGAAATLTSNHAAALQARLGEQDVQLRWGPPPEAAGVTVKGRGHAACASI